jgi:hypothetical protein
MRPVASRCPRKGRIYPGHRLVDQVACCNVETGENTPRRVYGYASYSQHSSVCPASQNAPLGFSPTATPTAYRVIYLAVYLAVHLAVRRTQVPTAGGASQSVTPSGARERRFGVPMLVRWKGQRGRSRMRRREFIARLGSTAAWTVWGGATARSIASTATEGGLHGKPQPNGKERPGSRYRRPPRNRSSSRDAVRSRPQ